MALYNSTTGPSTQRLINRVSKRISISKSSVELIDENVRYDDRNTDSFGYQFVKKLTIWANITKKK